MNPSATKYEATPSVEAHARVSVWLMALLLAFVTIVMYWPATRCGFITLDDELYVTSNFHVQQGLTLEGIKWAFLNPLGANWHPLTMLSHMLDCQLYGLNPWGHHLTSVLLHGVNTALVFILLRGLTGAFWRSVFVAALFGLHPLHVESVAWVSERKDVLSTCFGLITLVFYARYAQKQTRVESRKSRTNGTQPAFDPRPSTLDYSLALLFFVLGLMGKPMLVTWPFVLLLLDYWPLGRFERASVWRLVMEKVPFFALAVASSVVTFMVQRHAAAVMSVQGLSIAVRCENALISYCRYLGKLFWPTDMAIYYPHQGWPFWEVLVAGGITAGVSWLVWMKRREAPYMLMGWLWFVGTLVPVIGLVQVGEQSMADRYSYIPSLGVFILVIWGVYEMACHRRSLVIASSSSVCVALIICFALTRQQLGYWRDSETLMRHALAVTRDNYLAYNNLGYALYEKGQVDEAIPQYEKAMQINPDDVQTRNNLGIALYSKGQVDEAIRQYEKAIRLDPHYANAHYNLGIALDGKGLPDQAIGEYQQAIRLKPDHIDAHYNLGLALCTKGRLDEAMAEFEEVIRLKPDDAVAYNNIGNILFIKGQLDGAISLYTEAIRLKPDYGDAHYNLGAAFEKEGQLDGAISEFQEAVRLNPDDAGARKDLAGALEIKNAPARH